MGHVTDYEFGIAAIDAAYVRPQLAAIHLIVENGRAALVDSGSNASLPQVLAALAAKSLGPESVDYLILTHVHLDHAGGAGNLMAHLPNARLAVHPRGAPHMADPTRLVEASRAVYGVEGVRALYGDIVPVPAARIVETPDMAVLNLAGRELLVLDTPGHARHHVCILDRGSGHIFAGDTFGLCYREVERAGRQSIFATTSPPHFDPPALHRSIDRLLSYDPGAVYVTHYSQVREPARLGGDLHRLIDAHLDLARSRAEGDGSLHGRLVQGLTALLMAEARRYDWPIDAKAIWDVFATDVDVNAQGLAAWLASNR